MIDTLVKRWTEKEQDIKDYFSKNRPSTYSEIVKKVVEYVTTDEYGNCNLDPERITCIDHGDYQGTQLYIIAAKGYQPSTFWWVTVDYGSCSGCDTLQAIQGWSDEIPAKEAEGYFTLALHILQAIKPLATK